MVNAILGLGNDLPQRLAQIERQLRDLSTQPMLLNASTGQTGGKGLATDINGLHLFNTAGVEVATLSTIDGSLTAKNASISGTINQANTYGASSLGSVILGTAGAPGLVFTKTGTTYGTPVGIGLLTGTPDTLLVSGPSATAYGPYLVLTSDLAFNLASDSYTGATAGPTVSSSPGGSGSLSLSAGSTSGSIQMYPYGTGKVQVNGAFAVTGAKAFVMPHPLDPVNKTLMHASTESPVNGVEYWGEAVIDQTGTLTVKLPAYFEALTKTAGRTVQLTPSGGPCATVPWASKIASGQFTINAPAGSTIHWLVKAERQQIEGGTDVLGFQAETNAPTVTQKPAGGPSFPLTR